MKIVYCCWEYPPYPGTGGIGSYVQDAGREMVRLGHQVTVIAACPHTKKSGEENDKGVRVIRLSGCMCGHEKEELRFKNPWGYFTRTLHQRKSWRPYLIKIADTLDQLIDNTAADLVEFPDYFAEGLVWLKRPRRIPSVVRIHHSLSIKEQEILSQWLNGDKSKADTSVVQMIEEMRLADKVTSGSMRYKKKLADLTVLPDESITFIPNFINIADWRTSHYATWPLQPGQDKNAKHLFFAGTVAKHKGVLELVDAVEKLRDDGIKADLTLAGTTSRITSQLLSGNRSDWVTLLGKIPREKLAAFYTTSDLCCFPSHRESFGLTAVEAMACGALVLGAKDTAHDEFIQHGINGFMVEPRLSEQFRTVIRTALTLDHQARNDICKAARKTAFRYDAETVVPDMVRFYKSAAGLPLDS